jgi:agmatinase
MTADSASGPSAPATFDDLGVRGTIDAIVGRVADLPVYLSVDIDVLDPAFAPGTGTPEVGGLTNRELLRVLRGPIALNLVGADVVEVAPPFDHGRSLPWPQQP